MIERYNYRGDPNLGFAATVTPEYAVFPPEFKRKSFFDSLSVETFVSRTRLPGLFTAGNSSCILFPDSLTGHEKSKIHESDLNFEIVESVETALGNLVLANDSGALISPKLEDCSEAIEKALEVPVETGKIANIPNVGVAAYATSQGVLLHREASEDDARLVSEVLNVDEVDIGTVNLGSPYIGSGIVGHEKNILVGEDTSGPEVGRIDRTLHQSV